MLTQPEALAEASRLAREHYENFPVGSLLLPAALRVHVYRIYAFARVADDLADEARDLDALRAWRADLRAALDGSCDAPTLLVDLARSVRERSLSEALLFRLLDAFERDLAQYRYADFDDLLSYCRDSADPIGRLLLELFGCVDDESLRLSDRICTALQILNHCQDVRSDYIERNRVYLPQDGMRGLGVDEGDLALTRTSQALRTLVAELAAFCGRAFHDGWALCARLGGRPGLELRAILHGACLVLERMAASGFDVCGRRPRIHRRDAPEILLRSLCQSWPPRAARRAALVDPVAFALAER